MDRQPVTIDLVETDEDNIEITIQPSSIRVIVTFLDPGVSVSRVQRIAAIITENPALAEVPVLGSPARVSARAAMLPTMYPTTLPTQSPTNSFGGLLFAKQT